MWLLVVVVMVLVVLLLLLVVALVLLMVFFLVLLLLWLGWVLVAIVITGIRGRSHPTHACTTSFNTNLLRQKESMTPKAISNRCERQRRT